jgi:SAM-dependent methyltransferase
MEMKKKKTNQKRESGWDSGDAYEPYVGRWSRRVAPIFIDWLTVAASGIWLEVGCGTGALTQAILLRASPASIKAVDSSAEYLASAQARLHNPLVQFEIGDALSLPGLPGTYDAVVSGLMLNFVPEQARFVEEMKRVLLPGGMAAAYVWDYAGKMELMRHYWDAAAALDADAYELDEGQRFPICKPEALYALFTGSGLKDVEVRAIDIETHFRDFDDYWSPFLGGQGPAPGYAMSLSNDRRSALREKIRAGLPFASDGSIPLVARAWAVRGIK